MKRILLVAMLLAGCSAGDNEYQKYTKDAIEAAAADPVDTYVIHKPAFGCPAGWRLAEQGFSDGDACIRDGSGGATHIDVLKPGESASP